MKVSPRASFWQLVRASLLYHWRVQTAVVLGAAVGTAVLTGALLVGDSMRASLQQLALTRLGRIDQALVSDRFFTTRLVEKLEQDSAFRQYFTEAVPAVVLPATARWSPEEATLDQSVQANHVTLIACDERFWQLGKNVPKKLPGVGEVVINEALAKKLAFTASDSVRQIAPGDRLILRLPRQSTIPADNVLGEKRRTTRGLSLVVVDIVPNEGLGGFSLRPIQRNVPNAFVCLETVWQVVGKDRVNAILVAGKQMHQASPPDADQLLRQALKPTPEDCGIRLQEAPPGCLNITTDRLVLSPAAENHLLEQLRGFRVQPVLVHLANKIIAGDRWIPYSMVAALNPEKNPPLGPFVTIDGKPLEQIAANEIVLNDWAAEDLGVRPGDKIRLQYFEPEAKAGKLVETEHTFTLAAVVQLDDTLAKAKFTPEVPGVTDKASIRDWDAPFEPFHPEWIRIPDHPGPGNDEDYWDKYGTLPKAFVSLETGRKLWSSRFGQTTSLRVAMPPGVAAAQIRQRLQLDPTVFGLVFQPVKRQALVAASGTTSFAGLFIGMSFFVIMAAVMLVILLFRLGVDRRASEIGTLLALGFTRSKVFRLLVTEGIILAAVAGVLGLVIGLGYAAVMIYGLKTWWIGATGTTFLQFHATWQSLAVGYLAGVLLAVFAVVWALWYIRRTTIRTLLAGDTRPTELLLRKPGRVVVVISIAMLVLASATAIWGASATDAIEAAGAFFTAGFLLLFTYLIVLWAKVRAGVISAEPSAGAKSLLRLAVRNLSRHPGRSTLTAGLVAAATFIIVAMSAFRIDPAQQKPLRNSGNGGFAIVAEADHPFFFDLNNAEHRANIGLSDQEQQLFGRARIFMLRVRDGDNASCLNLYKARQPRLLGIPQALLDRGGFVIKPWIPTNKQEKNNPWLLLRRKLPAAEDGTPRIPAFLDADTATYSLHLSRGKNQTINIQDAQGRTLQLVIVGVLPGSIFQGDCLVSEDNLLRFFPQVAGYRFFLVECPAEVVPKLKQTMQQALADYGIEVETTGERLARFLTVQNTYISAFQSLGALGLLLGTLGLAAVQLRNVLERRRELALMRAVGFSPLRLAWMVMGENAALLLLGLGGGIVASIVAVVPHLFTRAAHIPWQWIAGTLIAVMAVGIGAGLVAIAAVLRAPLLAALRRE